MTRWDGLIKTYQVLSGLFNLFSFVSQFNYKYGINFNISYKKHTYCALLDSNPELQDDKYRQILPLLTRLPTFRRFSCWTNLLLKENDKNGWLGNCISVLMTLACIWRLGQWWYLLRPWLLLCCLLDSVTRKKSPNVYKSCPKMILLEKW